MISDARGEDVPRGDCVTTVVSVKLIEGETEGGADAEMGGVREATVDTENEGVT